MSVKSKLRERKAAAQARGDPESNLPKKRFVPSNPNGRPKGSTNRVGRTLREMIAALVENNMSGAQALYDKVAKRNPAQALSLLNKFAEFCLPKLTRTELQLPSAPISSQPITTAEEASRVYASIMGDTTIDLSAITFRPSADPSIVAEVPAAPATASDDPLENLNQ